MKRWLIALLLWGLAVPLWAQERRAWTHAHIHTAAGPVLENATLVVEKGKIVSVGSAPAPAGCQVVDVQGLHLYPSLIDADSLLGLFEIEGVRATHDHREVGDLNPDLQAEAAFHPDSEVIKVATSAGILVAGVLPQGSMFAGQGAVMKLSGWTREDMTVLPAAGLCLEWPSYAINRQVDADPPLPEQLKSRKSRLDKLNDSLANARAYLKGGRKPVDVFWEAMVPVLEGRRPVFVRAHRLDQIQDALTWAQTHQLKMVLVGGGDAWRISDRLARQGVGVIYTDTLKLPGRDHEGYDTYFSAPEKLRHQGVRVALSHGDDPANSRWLTQIAGLAQAFGMAPEHALQAITRVPAELLGVGDRLGTLEPGKDATFFLANGDILDGRTQVLRAWIDGAEIDLHDRQKRLYQRYRNRPR